MGFYYTRGPAKNFSTPPFFDHKSATKLPPEHKDFWGPKKRQKEHTFCKTGNGLSLLVGFAKMEVDLDKWLKKQ